MLAMSRALDSTRPHTQHLGRLWHAYHEWKSDCASEAILFLHMASHSTPECANACPSTGTSQPGG